jgi:hypothetical protein
MSIQTEVYVNLTPLLIRAFTYLYALLRAIPNFSIKSAAICDNFANKHQAFGASETTKYSPSTQTKNP